MQDLHWRLLGSMWLLQIYTIVQVRTRQLHAEVDTSTCSSTWRSTPEQHRTSLKKKKGHTDGAGPVRCLIRHARCEYASLLMAKSSQIWPRDPAVIDIRYLESDAFGNATSAKGVIAYRLGLEDHGERHLTCATLPE